jgi:hypothetical protein
VILTPHWSASTQEVFHATGQAMVRGMILAAHGRVPPNVVNQDVLDRPGFRAKLAHFEAELTIPGATAAVDGHRDAPRQSARAE